MHTARLLAPLLLLAASAGVQGLPILEDPQSDVALIATGQPQASPLATPGLDLRSLSAVETPSEFQFTVGVASMGDDADAASRQLEYRIDFRHNDAAYRVRIFHNFFGAPEAFDARLDVYDPGQASYVPVQDVPTVADVAAGTVTVAVPRELLKDLSGAAPFVGRALEAFVVESRSARFGSGININGQSASETYFSDRMPDSGVSAVALPVAAGLAQTGHARLFAAEPFRASNGEATTFVFRVAASNLAEQADTFLLDALGAPANWEVTVPGGVRIDANGELELPVIVRTPFAHAHGSSVSFVVEMTSRSDPGSVGRVELGVYYPAIPQPAGHHDTLHLRSRSTSDPLESALLTAFGTMFGGDFVREAYMNAADTDETDEAVPVGGFGCGSGLDNASVVTTYCWQIPLEPGLLMGLDFDLLRQGELKFPVASLLPLPNARLQGQLVYWPPSTEPAFFRDRDEAIVLADLLPADGVDVGANSEALLLAQVVARSEADLIPYQRGAALDLFVELVFARPDNPFFGPRVYPELAPGGSLRLPLLEYEDPVDETFYVSDLVLLDAIGERERRVNPGETVVFRARLENQGDATDTFDVSLSGPNRQWAILDRMEATLVSGDGVDILVAVAAPAEARTGEKADLLLQAISRSDPNAQALLRIKAVVDSSIDLPDEAGQVATQAKKSSPAAPFLALLAGLGAAAAAARRR